MRFGVFEVRGFWCGVLGFRFFRRPGFRVRDAGLGFLFIEVRVSGSGFRGSRFRVRGFEAQGFGFEVRGFRGSRFRVRGCRLGVGFVLGFGVSGLGFWLRVWGFVDLCLGFRVFEVRGFGFGVRIWFQGLRFGVLRSWVLRFWVQGFEIWVRVSCFALAFLVRGFGVRVSGFALSFRGFKFGVSSFRGSI